MKKIIFLLCTAMIAVACNTPPTPTDPNPTDPSYHNFENDKTTLYLATNITTKPDSNKVENLTELTAVKKDEVKTITSARFEISLNKTDDSTGYMAQRKVTTSTANAAITKTEYICDWCGAASLFKTQEGFINFMSSRGYKLNSQTENANGTDYIFDKI